MNVFINCLALQSTARFVNRPDGQGVGRKGGRDPRPNKTMPKLRKLALAVALCLIVSLGPNGCDTFVTVRDTQASGKSDEAGEVKIENGRLSGLVYYLPKGRIRITGDFKPSSAPGGSDSKPGPGGNDGASKPPRPLMEKLSREDSGESSDSEQKNFYITVSVDIEADPRARYYLKAERNYFYDDDLNLKINAKHLLSTGNATVEDQTAQIISSTAQIVAQFAGVPGETKEAPPSVLKVRDLQNRIVENAAENNISLNTRITVSRTALENLKDALPPPSEDNRNEIEARLSKLSAKDKTWFTPKEIRDLLKLFKLDDIVQLGRPSSKELFAKLFATLETPKMIVPTRPFSVVFDPNDRQDFPEVAKCGFLVSVLPQAVADIAIHHKAWSSDKPEHVHGIAFRTVIPYELEIRSIPNTWFYIHEKRILLLPDTNRDHTLVLDYSRVPFVKKTTNIAFVDGIPQDLGQKVPSPVLGFLAIPKGILQALVPLPQTMAGPSGMQAMGNSTAGAATSPPPQSH
jgi:hypothetical protein